MVEKFNLKINVDEARVLLASVDKNSSGDLQIDEFIDLIFNEHDILKVDLSKLRPLSEAEKEVILRD